MALTTVIGGRLKRAMGILVTSGLLLLIGVDAHAFAGGELSMQSKLSLAQARAVP